MGETQSGLTFYMDPSSCSWRFKWREQECLAREPFCRVYRSRLEIMVVLTEDDN